MHPIRALKAQPDRLILAVILPLVLLACLGLYLLLSGTLPDAAVHSADGVWDLRGYDLSEGNVQILGGVSAIPGALLTPREYAARQDEAVLLADAFPEPCGTSRLQVLLPEGSWYTFTRNSIDYGTKLYVNGELLAEVGTVADSAAAAVADSGQITFTAQPVNGVVELVVQSSNFVHRNGGYHGGWLVGGSGLARAAEAARFAIVLEMGAYVTLMLLHLLLFWMLPRYKPNLYFALACFTWFLRMGTTGGSPFTVLLPWLPWGVKFRLEYAAVSLVILLTGLIMRDVFPGIMQRWAMRVVYATNGLFLLFCLVLPTKALSWAGTIFLLPCLLTAVYVTVRLATKFRRPRVDQSLLLAGICLMVCAAVWDVAQYARYLSQPGNLYVEVTQIAVLAFTLLAASAFFIATMREVRKAKDAEQRLAAENAALEQVNRLKSDLMGTLSHELRTPLAVMSGYAQLSERQIANGSANDETRRNLRVVTREAQRLATLAGGLLQDTLLGGTLQKRESLSVSALFGRAAAVCRPILEKSGNRLITTAPQGLPPVVVNGDMVHQVLLNLLTNAGRYTSNGVVELAAEAGKPGFVAVTVADNGQGMDPALLDHALEPGVTDGSGGGLGLAICRQIIEDHGGDISIESGPDTGTRVRFTLPAKNPDE